MVHRSPAAVVDHDRAPERFGPCAMGASRDTVAAPRAPSHDQPNRLGGIGLSERTAAAKSRRRDDRTSWAHHAGGNPGNTTITIARSRPSSTRVRRRPEVSRWAFAEIEARSKPGRSCLHRAAARRRRADRVSRARTPKPRRATSPKLHVKHVSVISNRYEGQLMARTIRASCTASRSATASDRSFKRVPARPRPARAHPAARRRRDAVREPRDATTRGRRAQRTLEGCRRCSSRLLELRRRRGSPT